MGVAAKSAVSHPVSSLADLRLGTVTGRETLPSAGPLLPHPHPGGRLLMEIEVLKAQGLELTMTKYCEWTSYAQFKVMLLLGIRM